MHPTRDPVRIINSVTTFLGAILALIIGAGWVDEVVGGVILGILVAANAFAQELFVRPATVPRVPLEELAAQES